MSPILILSVSWLGSYLGGLLLWGLGHVWLKNPPLRFIGWLSASGGLEKARELVRKHGAIIVVLSRFIPGIRSLIILAAGLAGMGFGRIIWAVAAAVLIWQSILVAGGYLVGLHWLKVVSVISKVGLYAAVAVAIAVYVGWRRSRASRSLL